jgi:DNA-binding MarR family transcriptional regulator
VKLEQALKTEKFSSPMHKASLNILYTAWWLKSIFSKELKTAHFTQEQFNVMRILKGKHPEKMFVKDIASRMIEQNSNVPRIIDRLEKKQWVTRTQCENDGRHSKIGLSEAGISALNNANTRVQNLSETMFSLTNDEAITLNNLLEKVRT